MIITAGIKEIAEDIRQEFEFCRVDNGLLAKLYIKYSNVPDIEDFLKQARESFPKLNCGLATVYLRHRLGEGEIVNGKYGKENHSFLLLNGKTVIDITADQYGGPRVYCGPLKPPWAAPHKQAIRFFH